MSVDSGICVSIDKYISLIHKHFSLIFSSSLISSTFPITTNATETSRVFNIWWTSHAQLIVSKNIQKSNDNWSRLYPMTGREAAISQRPNPKSEITGPKPCIPVLYHQDSFYSARYLKGANEGLQADFETIANVAACWYFWDMICYGKRACPRNISVLLHLKSFWNQLANPPGVFKLFVIRFRSGLAVPGGGRVSYTHQKKKVNV